MINKKSGTRYTAFIRSFITKLIILISIHSCIGMILVGTSHAKNDGTWFYFYNPNDYQIRLSLKRTEGDCYEGFGAARYNPNAHGTDWGKRNSWVAVLDGQKVSAIKNQRDCEDDPRGTWDNVNNLCKAKEISLEDIASAGTNGNIRTCDGNLSASCSDRFDGPTDSSWASDKEATKTLTLDRKERNPQTVKVYSFNWDDKFINKTDTGEVTGTTLTSLYVHRETKDNNCNDANVKFDIKVEKYKNGKWVKHNLAGDSAPKLDYTMTFKMGQSGYLHAKSGYFKSWSEYHNDFIVAGAVHGEPEFGPCTERKEFKNCRDTSFFNGLFTSKTLPGERIGRTYFQSNDDWPQSTSTRRAHVIKLKQLPENLIINTDVNLEWSNVSTELDSEQEKTCESTTKEIHRKEDTSLGLNLEVGQGWMASTFEGISWKVGMNMKSSIENNQSLRYNTSYCKTSTYKYFDASGEPFHSHVCGRSGSQGRPIKITRWVSDKNDRGEEVPRMIEEDVINWCNDNNVEVAAARNFYMRNKGQQGCKLPEAFRPKISLEVKACVNCQLKKATNKDRGFLDLITNYAAGLGYDGGGSTGMFDFHTKELVKNDVGDVAAELKGSHSALYWLPGGLKLSTNDDGDTVCEFEMDCGKDYTTNPQGDPRGQTPSSCGILPSQIFYDLYNRG